MIRTDNVDGSYILIASNGLDLIALDAEGNEVGRTKSVTIPAEGTLLTWTAGPEKPPEAVADERVQRIAQIQEEMAALEEQLAALKEEGGGS